MSSRILKEKSEYVMWVMWGSMTALNNDGAVPSLSSLLWLTL